MYKVLLNGVTVLRSEDERRVINYSVDLFAELLNNTTYKKALRSITILDNEEGLEKEMMVDFEREMRYRKKTLEKRVDEKNLINRYDNLMNKFNNASEEDTNRLLKIKLAIENYEKEL